MITSKGNNDMWENFDKQITNINQAIAKDDKANEKDEKAKDINIKAQAKEVTAEKKGGEGLEETQTAHQFSEISENFSTSSTAQKTNFSAEKTFQTLNQVKILMQKTEKLQNIPAENKKIILENQREIDHILALAHQQEKELLQFHVIFHEGVIQHPNHANPAHEAFYDRKEVGIVQNGVFVFSEKMKEKILEHTKKNTLHHIDPKGNKQTVQPQQIGVITQQDLNNAINLKNNYKNNLQKLQNLVNAQHNLLLQTLYQQTNVELKDSDAHSVSLLQKILPSVLNLSSVHTFIKKTDLYNTKNKKIDEFLKKTRQGQEKAFAFLVSFVHQFNENQKKIRLKKERDEHERVIKENEKKIDREYYIKKDLNDREDNTREDIAKQS